MDVTANPGAAWLRQGIVRVGLDRTARRLWGGCGAILVMHRVREAPTGDWCGDPGLYVTSAQLIHVIDTLRSEGFEIVSLDEAVFRLQNPAAGRRFACLTFDDGYRDNFDLLLPILRQYQAPATVYVTSGFIDGISPAWWQVIETVLQRHSVLAVELDGNKHEWRSRTLTERSAVYREVCALLRAASPANRERCLTEVARRYEIDPRQVTVSQMMTWDMVRQLAESGLVAIGAHTVNHPALRGLPREVIHREIAAGRTRLQEMIGKPVRHFAYPYGSADTTSRDVARELAFASAVLSSGGPLTRRSSLYALPRIAFGMSANIVDLRIRLSGAGPALRRWVGRQPS